MQCMMDHIVLNVEDEEKMMAFYTQVLMLASERLEEYRAGKVPFPSVRMNADTIIDLFPKKLWLRNSTNGNGRNNLNHFCISMSQKAWEELLERLNDNPVDIEEGPTPRWGRMVPEPPFILEIRKGTSLKRGIMTNRIARKSVCLDRRQRRYLM